MATDSKFLTLVGGICTQVTSISSFTGNANEIISTDSSGLISADLLPVDTDTFTWSAARNSNNVSNQFLRRQDRAPTNLAPYITPYDATIYYVTASSQSNEPDASTWDAAISINGGAAIVLASVPSTGDQVEAAVNQDLNAGDTVGIQMVNQSASINRPAINLYVRRR